MSKTNFAIGVDLGGTNIKIGIVDQNGSVLQRKSVPVGEKRSAAGVVAQIIDEVKQLMKLSPGTVKAVGCGVPGIVDFEKGVVFGSPNFPEWNEVPMRVLLSKGLRFPVIIDNDANLHALGEARFGVGRGLDNMVLLTLGTGIGGGIILNNNIFHGDRGFAGEVGHIVVEKDGVPCGCGGLGCLEKYAASKGFVAHASKLAKDELEELLVAAGTDVSGLTPEIMFSLAKAGNKQSISLWKEFGRYLGIGIAILLNVLGVETFIIGGGIAKAWVLFIDAARTEALRHTYKYHSDKLHIKPAALGDDAGVIGAATEALL